MKKVLAIGLLLGGLASAGLQAALPSATSITANVQLLVSGTAHGPNVLLKDVIATGLPDGIANTALKVAGRPGNTVTVAKALVQLKLKALKSNLVVQGPLECQLKVGSQTLPGAQIQSFAAEYLAGQLSSTTGVKIEAKEVPKDFQTYDAATRFSIRPSGQEWRGNVVLRVQVLQSGVGGEDHEVASVPVSFMVRRQEQKVFATKTFRKGQVLEEGGLSLRDVDTTFDQAQGFSRLDEVAGKNARAYIGAGKAVSADMVEIPALIKRGDIIRLVVRSGGVVVETTAKAMRDARKGENLTVELEASHKQVPARCVEVGVAVRDAF